LIALNISPGELLELPAKKSRRAASRAVVVRSRKQVVFYSKLVILSIEDALEGAGKDRHHNHPPSDLIVDDDQYLQELRNLVAELKRLNFPARTETHT
jgi:hypothetical protein